MEALSAGTRAASHPSNSGQPTHVLPGDEDAERRTTFEGASTRTGRTPDELNAVLRALGRNPDGDDDPAVDSTTAVLAPTERLTGAGVNEQLLTDAVHQIGDVAEEPADGWETVTIGVARFVVPSGGAACCVA